ncbi:hypothetical protein [Spiroplasma endosymbiont of Panorpa germanica]|uniref:hypothetical protein n=1 Tax=Spiroplasma endosymbiont of Panorpa germanica TaxID=3066314 RepID=UPI0030D19629
MKKDVKVLKINRPSDGDSFNKKYFNPLESVWYEDEFTEEFNEGIADLDQTIANISLNKTFKKPQNANAHFFNNNITKINENIFTKDDTIKDPEAIKHQNNNSLESDKYFDHVHNTSLNVLGPDDVLNAKTDLPKSIIELREKAFLNEMRQKRNQQNLTQENINQFSKISSIQEVEFKKPFTNVIEEFEVEQKPLGRDEFATNFNGPEFNAAQNQATKSEQLVEKTILDSSSFQNPSNLKDNQNLINQQSIVLNNNPSSDSVIKKSVVEETVIHQQDNSNIVSREVLADKHTDVSHSVKEKIKIQKQPLRNQEQEFYPNIFVDNSKTQKSVNKHFKEEIIEPIFHDFERVDKEHRVVFKNDAETLFNNKEIDSIFEQSGRANKVVNNNFFNGDLTQNQEGEYNPYVLPRTIARKNYDIELDGIFVKPQKKVVKIESSNQVIIPTRKNIQSEEYQKMQIRYNAHNSDREPAKKILNNILINKITNNEKTQQLKIKQPIINNFEQTALFQNDDFNSAVISRKGLPTDELNFINPESNSTTEILKSLGTGIQKNILINDEYTSDDFDDFENWFGKTRSAKKIKKIAQKEHKLLQKFKK